MNPCHAITPDPLGGVLGLLRGAGIAVADDLPGRADAWGQPDAAREEETRIAARVPEDPSQMEILYDRYYARILNYLYRRTMDRDLAEELTSRTFLRALEALGRETRPIWVCPWLYRIATNVHLSHSRRVTTLRARLAEIGRHWLGTERQPERRPDALASHREEQARLRRCLLTLPEKYRTVLLLRYDEELSHAGIAEVLQLGCPAVRKRLERGLRMLTERYRPGGQKGDAR